MAPIPYLSLLPRHYGGLDGGSIANKYCLDYPTMQTPAVRDGGLTTPLTTIIGQ